MSKVSLRAYLIGGDVAATRETPGDQKWLALSPRRRLGDISRGDNQFARKSRGRRRDVSETSSQLRRRLRQLLPYFIGLETRWRPGGDSSLRDVSWRLAGSPGNSNMFDLFGDFFPVSSRSRRRRRIVPATSPQSPWSPAGLGDVAVAAWCLQANEIGTLHFNGTNLHKHVRTKSNYTSLFLHHSSNTVHRYRKTT